MPSRIIPKSYRGVTGIFPSRKSVGQARFESLLERDLYIQIEFDDGVEKFEVQPVKIEWVDSESKRRTYTPDVLITFFPSNPRVVGNLVWLCEVKDESTLKQESRKFREKFKIAEEYASARGWKFHVLTENEIRTDYLKNLDFLRSFKIMEVSEDVKQVLLMALKEIQVSTPEALIAACFHRRWNRAQLLAPLWHLIATRQIFCDLNDLLTMNSHICSFAPFGYQPGSLCHKVYR